jgi:hypothetical protein
MPVNLLIPTNTGEVIDFVPDAEYQINYQIMGGWPTSYGLVITQGRKLIFQGVTDWQVIGNIHLEDSTLMQVSSQFKVEQGRVLSNHYIANPGDAYQRMTNIEVVFSLDGNSVTMHQGEAGLLGDFQVNLLVARIIKYRPQVTDAGVNGVSYTITKKGAL